jgi:heptosyltransferase-3
MRILFITATRIGDAVISTGLLQHLVKQNPDAKITIACGPLAASLFAAVPGLDEVIVLEKKSFGRHWITLWAKVKKTRWDLIVDLRRSLISYLVRTTTRARLGPDDGQSHRVEFLSTLFKLDPPSAPKIWISPDHEIRTNNIVASGSPVVAMAPVAARPDKTWPAEYFLELADRLVGTDGPFSQGKILTVGGEEDRDALEAFMSNVSAEKRLSLIGCPDLLTVCAALSRVQLAVANDSGIAHLAAAAGCPIVALFGPTRPDLYRPWGSRVAVAHAPFGPRGYQMADLTVNAAYAAVKTVLK